MEDHSEFCIKSIKQDEFEQNIPITDGFDFGEALASVFPLLELVFQYLPLIDLKSCIETCSKWKSVAEKVIRRRIAPSFFTCYKLQTFKNKKIKSNIIVASPTLHFNNVELGIIFYDDSRIKINKYVCVHTQVNELSRKTVPEYLEEELVPKSVDYCLLSVPRVVSTFDRNRLDLENLKYGSIFDGVFIPKIERMRTVLFHCNPAKKNELKETISNYIKPNERVKCLLLFCKTTLREALHNLLSLLITDYDREKSWGKSIALGGGIIRGTKTFQVDCTHKKIFPAKDTVCVAFLENAEFENTFSAFSCVIKGHDLSSAEFEAELQKFRNKVTLKKYSFCFLIRCSAKFQKENELVLFEKVFENVPLLGVDAYGEIGWNNYRTDVEDYQDTNPKKKRKKQVERDVEHQWSSVFVITTWD